MLPAGFECEIPQSQKKNVPSEYPYSEKSVQSSIILTTMHTRTFALLLAALILLPITTFCQAPLQAQFADIIHGTDGRVGVFAMVLETGDTASFNGAERFPMQSVYKFPIAMAILDRVDKGRLGLDQKILVKKSDLLRHGHSPIRDKYPQGNIELSVEELLRYNIGESDGTACDVLLRILGGASAADRYVHRLGVKEIAIATTEQVQQGADEMIQYRNWATPAAMVQLLERVNGKEALSDSSTALLVKLMAESGPGAKRLKGLLPAGTIVAHKTGTAATVNGLTRATNDAGLITLPDGKHLAMAVFVADSRAGQEEREAVIAKLARAAWDHWTK
jgi:beta-lactamase class A